MLSAGYNCRDLLNVVLMRPVFSPTEYIQIKGRGTRRHTFIVGNTEYEKKYYFLLDFCAVAEFFEEKYDYSTPLKLASVSSQLLGRLSPADTGQDRAVASDPEEPHPARELLPAGRSQDRDRALRRLLQSPPLPREPEQSDARRRLLRARRNHLTRKGENQTKHHQPTALAAPQNRRLN